MQLNLRVKIPLSRPEVWQGLNDPELLQACLPGCESFDRVGDNLFDVVLLAKVGPVKARFKGQVSLTEVVAPASYRMNGAGKGGVAGFAKGEAEIKLVAVEQDSTVMTCAVTATVGGKLAQVGSRLIFGAARKMATEFFGRFARLVTGDDAREVELETLEAST